MSVFGLAFVCAFATFFVSLDLAALRFLGALSRFRRMRGLGPRLERWVMDGVLQLQRRAYEYAGQGEWVGTEREVPVTRGRGALVDLKDGMGEVEVVKGEEEAGEKKSKEGDGSMKGVERTRTEATLVDGVDSGRSGRRLERDEGAPERG